MSHANLDDRGSVERIYPRAAHDEDAAENARPKATVHHGVRIEAPMSGAGDVRLVRASRHVGEAGEEQNALFLFPVRAPESPASTGYAAPQSAPDAARPASGAGDAYEDFITRMIETARQANFLDSIGRDEDRLRGPHGG